MDATSSTDTPPVIQGGMDTCPGCGELFDRSALTDSFVNSYGHAGSIVYADGDHMHLHGVSIAALDALTVRGSIKRWANHARIRARWRLRGLRKYAARMSGSA